MFSEAEIKQYVPYVVNRVPFSQDGNQEIEFVRLKFLRLWRSPFSNDTHEEIVISQKRKYSLFEREVANILDLDAVRLPVEELRATGPGPESAFVASMGRRTESGDSFFEGFFSEKHLFVERVKIMKDVFMEGLGYFWSRVGYY